jgi:two-component system sensor histidine kinase KdpD
LAATIADVPRGFPGYLYSLAVVGLSTALAASMFPYFDLANLIMVYLLGVVVVAGRWGRGPSLLAAALSVGAFDFLFVPPYFTLAVSSTRHLLTFAVMGIVALVIGTLTVRIREQAEAAEGHRLRHALLAAVSHDLRTPLASIAGAASSLAATPERLDAGGRRELVLTIHEEAQRMSRLVTDLLEMARLQSRRPTLRREWQPLEEVLGAALHHLDRQIGEREIVLHVPDDLPLVEIDDVLIERVLVNLLDNALRYSASGAAIELAAQASGGAVTVAILDRGPGLAPGEETRIFDEFVRGDAAQSRDGVGLGLALARAIVEAHGGRIWAENRPEGGTAFRFTVPSAP